jgi:hypothetical protein
MLQRCGARGEIATQAHADEHRLSPSTSGRVSA